MCNSCQSFKLLWPLSPLPFNFGYRCFGLYRYSLTEGTLSQSISHSSWDTLYNIWFNFLYASCGFLSNCIHIGDLITIFMMCIHFTNTYVLTYLLTHSLTYSLLEKPKVFHLVLLEKLKVFQLVNKLPAFVEPRCSLLHSKVTTSCPYAEPAQSSPLSEDTYYYPLI